MKEYPALYIAEKRGDLPPRDAVSIEVRACHLTTEPGRCAVRQFAGDRLLGHLQQNGAQYAVIIRPRCGGPVCMWFREENDLVQSVVDLVRETGSADTILLFAFASDDGLRNKLIAAMQAQEFAATPPEGRS